MTEWWLMPPQPPPSDDNLTGWAAPSPNKDPSQWWVWRDPTACLSSPCSGPASGYVNCNNGSGRPSRNIWPNFYQVKSDKIIFFLQTTLKLNIKIKSFRTRQNVYKMFIVRWIDGGCQLFVMQCNSDIRTWQPLEITPHLKMFKTWKTWLPV